MDKKELSGLIGSNIAYWRKERHLTQEQLSEKLNISKQFLAHVERGERIFSVPMLRAAALALDISADALLFERDINEIRKQNILRILSEKEPEEIKRMEQMMAVCAQLCEISDNGLMSE